MDEAGEAARSERSQTLVAFARDVLVNVLANLIAAAIIYLLTVATGLLPRTPLLVFAALSFIFASVAIGFYILAFRLGAQRRGLRFRALGIICAGMVIELNSFFTRDVTLWARIPLHIAGLVLIILGIQLMVSLRRVANRLK
jgi:xanthine/uracil permease